MSCHLSKLLTSELEAPVVSYGYETIPCQALGQQVGNELRIVLCHSELKVSDLDLLRRDETPSVHSLHHVGP